MGDRPADVVANGCPFCGGPALFVHGSRLGRVCDRCDTAWDVESLGYAIAYTMLVAFGVRST